ncbi:hypothetical protein WDU94_008732 [Cyamophila willieti]
MSEFVERLMEKLKVSSTYSIVYSKLLRPSTLYSLVTTFHQSDEGVDILSLEDMDMLTSHTIMASVTSQTWEVASGSERISIFQPSTITLPIPASIKNSTYTLRVQGFSPSKSLLFQHIAPLHFTPYFLSVTVQTSRPIYSSRQEVKFRIVILETDLLPYHDDLDVFVLDPDGIIMRRWISIFTNNGVSSLSFTLPNLAKDGTWKIRTSIQDQFNEHMFQVQTYFTPLFEVFVELPKYISDTETSLSATVYAMFATQKYVRGKGVIVWSARKYDATRNNWNVYNGTSTREFKEILRMEKFITESKNTFTLVFSELPEPVTPGLEVRLDVTLTELLSGETMSGYSTSRVAHSQVNVEFLSRQPLYYHVGKPLQGHVSVNYLGGQSLSPDDLVDSQLKMDLLRMDATEKQSIIVQERTRSAKRNVC